MEYARTLNRLLSAGGNFWNEGFQDRRQPLSLIRGTETELFTDTLARALLWGKRTEWLPVKNRTLNWFDSTRHVLGVDLQKRLVLEYEEDGTPHTVISRPHPNDLQDDPHTLPDDQMDGTLFDPTNLQTRYLIEIGRNFKPVLIRTRDRDLVTGFDFQTQGDWLILFEAPEVLFPDGRITVVTGYERAPWIYDYLQGLSDVRGDTHSRIRYFKKTGGGLSFARAAIAVAGYTQLEEDALLTNVIPLDGVKKRYIYTDRVIDTHYPHISDRRGITYSKHHVPGSPVRVRSTLDDGVGWWKNTNWTMGLPLLKGKLFLMREVVTMEAVEEYNGNFHLRSELGVVNIDVANEFWGLIHGYEKRSDIWLNDIEDEDGNPIFGFTAVGQTTDVNLFDILLRHHFSNRLIVFEVNISTIADTNRIKFEKFIQEERPTDVLVIVRYYDPTVDVGVDTPTTFVVVYNGDTVVYNDQSVTYTI